MIRTDKHAKNDTIEALDAIDALNKVRAILNAAMYLTSTEEEKEAGLELIGIAESVAARVLETMP